MIAFVRHGRTAANKAGLLLGRADPPLDELGREQAAKVAAALANERSPVGAVVTSPLRRARETAELIAAAVGVPVEIEERLIEMDYGEWDEQPFSSIPVDVSTRWREDVTFAPPGGESLEALGARVAGGVVDLISRATGGTIVAVSHVSPIKAAVLRSLGLDDALAWRLRLDPASITRVANGPAGAVLLSFNETGHLH